MSRVYGVRVPDREPSLPHQIVLVFASHGRCLDGTPAIKNAVVVTCNCHARDSHNHYQDYIGLAPSTRDAWRKYNQPAFHNQSHGEFHPDGRMMMKYGVIEVRERAI